VSGRPVAERGKGEMGERLTGFRQPVGLGRTPLLLVVRTRRAPLFNSNGVCGNQPSVGPIDKSGYAGCRVALFKTLMSVWRRWGDDGLDKTPSELIKLRGRFPRVGVGPPSLMDLDPLGFRWGWCSTKIRAPEELWSGGLAVANRSGCAAQRVRILRDEERKLGAATSPDSPR